METPPRQHTFADGEDAIRNVEKVQAFCGLRSPDCYGTTGVVTARVPIRSERFTMAQMRLALFGMALAVCGNPQITGSEPAQIEESAK
jgi:hypothetical protein